MEIRFLLLTLSAGEEREVLVGLAFSNLASSSNARWCRLRMKRKKAAKEPRSRTTTTGTTIAGMRVLDFVLEELWALAAELVEAAALAVPLPVTPVVVVEDTAVSRAPSAESEASWAELETGIGTPCVCVSVTLPERKVVVV